MEKSDIQNAPATGKRRGRPPTGRTGFHIKLSAAEQERLAALAAAESDAPTMQEMIRRLIVRARVRRPAE